MRKLVADCWSCGDDCCCWYPQITEWSDEHITPKPSRLMYKDTLYEGSWQHDYPDRKNKEEVENFEEIRKEFKQACDQHGIEIDLSSDCCWDWRAERIIE